MRKAANIGEGDDVLVEVKDGVILMKVFKPRVVDVEPELIEKLLEEEVKLEEGEKFVLDTGVLVEYIVERAPYRPIVKKLLDEASSGRVRLYATPITLSETLYVASRIYEKAELSNPNEEALNYISWIKGRVKVTKIDEQVAIKSGELKKELRLALPDCYVLATAESMNAVPLFRKLEKKMERVFDRLRKMKTKFLGEAF